MALLREPTSRIDLGPNHNGVEPPLTKPSKLTDTTRRRPSLVLGGGLLVALAAVAGAWLFASVSTSISIMVLAHDVETGDVIDSGDLRVIESGNLAGARAIQPEQQHLIVGQAALGPMPAGTVVSTGLFSDRSNVIPVGMAVVGAELQPGAAPAGALVPGDHVSLLAANQTSLASSAAREAVVLATGTIWAVQHSDGAYNGRLVMSVLVPIADQGAVAQAASDGLLRVTLTGGAAS